MSDKQISDIKASNTGQDFKQRQKRKNIALGLAIIGLCILFYVISIVRMSGAS